MTMPGASIAQGASSKNRSRSQAGTAFPASYLAGMNQALGPQQNPLTTIGSNIGQSKGGLFGRTPQTAGYGQTGMFNFGLNMAVTSPEYIRRNFPDQQQTGRWNPYSPLLFEKEQYDPYIPGPGEPSDPNNPQWRGWQGERPGDWNLTPELLGVYGSAGTVRGWKWKPTNPGDPNDYDGQWVYEYAAGGGSPDDNPHLISHQGRFYLYGSEISKEQYDYLNIESDQDIVSGPRVPPGTTYLMENTQGWGMPRELWDMYHNQTAWGLSWIGGEWVAVGGKNLSAARKATIATSRHGAIDPANENKMPDLVWWPETPGDINDGYYFRGWKMDKAQIDRLQNPEPGMLSTDDWLKLAYDAESQSPHQDPTDTPGRETVFGNPDDSDYKPGAICKWNTGGIGGFLDRVCRDPHTGEEVDEDEIQRRNDAGGTILEVPVAGQDPMNETGGGTSPYASNRIPIDQYYVDPGFITEAILKIDPDKSGDFYRLFFESDGIYKKLKKTPGTITLGDLWYVYENLGEFGLSGRSKGDFFLLIGDIHSRKLLEEQSGPEGIFGSLSGADQFIDPAPGTGFSERVPQWIKEDYRDGKAKGWSWDGARWVRLVSDPEVVWDDPSRKHVIMKIDENNQNYNEIVPGTGKIFYRGQEISQEQWENMQQFGPISGLKQTSENISTSFLDGTARGFSWQNGQWQPDVGRPDLVWDAENDTPYFRGQLITPDQYLAIVREGPQVMGTAATAQHLLSQVSSGVGPEGRISQEDLDKFQNWAGVNNISREDLPGIRDQVIDPAQASAALIADSPNFRFDPSFINRDFGYDAAQIGPSQFNFDPASYEAPLITETNQFLQPNIYQALTAAPTEAYERGRELKTSQEEARLAAMGLADSAAGHGQLLRGLEPLDRQQQAMLYGAAGQATQLSKDYALKIEMANQQARAAAQEQAAGFRQEAAKFGGQTEYEIAASNQKFLQEARQFTGNAQVQIAMANQKFANDAGRYGVEVAFNLQVANQKALQEANLTNAGFTQEAVLRTAANFLQGDMTTFENMARIAQTTQDAQIRADVANMQSYANALGLNIQSLFKERDNFLQSLGLMQRDVQMESETERAFLALAFGEWQSQRNAIASAGRFNTSIQRASEEGGFNMNLSVPTGP